MKQQKVESNAHRTERAEWRPRISASFVEKMCEKENPDKITINHILWREISRQRPRIDLVKRLIKAGARIEYIDEIGGGSGKTAIQYSINNTRKETAKREEDKTGGVRSKEINRLLIEAGAIMDPPGNTVATEDVAEQRSLGRLLLRELSRSHPRREILKWLINAGARIDPIDERGGVTNAVQYATENGNAEIAELLKAHGAQE